MAYDIDEIEGIGAAYAEKLVSAGIKSTEDLLRYCCDAQGRKSISEQTGVGEGQLLKWANMADLMRISGVGKQYAELLEAAGVDTVKELRNRRFDNLAEKMKEINDEKGLAKTSPAPGTVEKWVSQAKTLDPKISH